MTFPMTSFLISAVCWCMPEGIQRGVEVRVHILGGLAVGERGVCGLLVHAWKHTEGGRG